MITKKRFFTIFLKYVLIGYCYNIIIIYSRSLDQLFLLNSRENKESSLVAIIRSFYTSVIWSNFSPPTAFLITRCEHFSKCDYCFQERMSATCIYSLPYHYEYTFIVLYTIKTSILFSLHLFDYMIYYKIRVIFVYAYRFAIKFGI